MENSCERRQFCRENQNAATLILLRQILWKPAAKEGSFAGKTKMLPLVFESAGNSGGKLAQKVTDR